MKRILLISVILAAMLLNACAAPVITPGPTPTETPTPMHTLSVSISPSGAGSVSPPGGKYESGLQVTLTATPTSGNTFDYWDDAASGSSNTVTITMDSNKSATAHFKVANIPPVQITPVPMKPDTGHITGRVVYTDNTAAYQTQVYVFKRGAFMSTAVEFTNTNGEYIFSELSIDEYEIYAAIYRDYSLETPDATVRVNDRQITTVPTIVVPREVEFDEQLGWDCPNDIELSVSWGGITNAVSYRVTVASNLNAASPGPIGYKNQATTTETKVKWPLLELGGYQITVIAYDQSNQMVGIGHDFFTIVDADISRN